MRENGRCLVEVRSRRRHRRWRILARMENPTCRARYECAGGETERMRCRAWTESVLGATAWRVGSRTSRVGSQRGACWERRCGVLRAKGLGQGKRVGSQGGLLRADDRVGAVGVEYAFGIYINYTHI